MEAFAILALGWFLGAVTQRHLEYRQVRRLQRESGPVPVDQEIANLHTSLAARKNPPQALLILLGAMERTVRGLGGEDRRMLLNIRMVTPKTEITIINRVAEVSDGDV